MTYLLDKVVSLLEQVVRRLDADILDLRCRLEAEHHKQHAVPVPGCDECALLEMYPELERK